MQNQGFSNSVFDHQSSFTVLKQKDSRSPVYLIEVCSRTNEVLSKEIIQKIPPHWTLDDFYSMWNVGRQVEVKL